jgi:hypothetical protein
MGLEFGGSKAWRVFSKGEVAVAFHWIGGEPAMCLFPTNKHMGLTGAMPWVMPLERAHDLVKDGSNGVVVDSEALWLKARDATIAMGFGEDFQVAKKVADLILNHLDDLCDMPPEPQPFEAARRPAPTGEIALKVDGTEVFRGEA